MPQDDALQDSQCSIEKTRKRSFGLNNKTSNRRRMQLYSDRLSKMLNNVSIFSAVLSCLIVFLMPFWQKSKLLWNSSVKVSYLNIENICFATNIKNKTVNFLKFPMCTIWSHRDCCKSTYQHVLTVFLLTIQSLTVSFCLRTWGNLYS